MNSTITFSFAAFAKNCSYVVAFCVGANFLGLTPISVFVLTLFIVMDIIAGITKSYILHGGSSIKSSILERGIIAKCTVILIPILIALAGKGVDIQVSGLTQGVITTLIFSELYSILGNWYAIRTGNEKQEFDAVAYVVSQLKNILRKIIQDDK